MREAKVMKCTVPVEYKDGYWLHDFPDRSSYVDGEDFVPLIDSEAENN